MDQVRAVLKFMGAQALGLFIVFNVVVWTICLGYSISSVVGSSPQLSVPGLGRPSRMAALPNYAGVDWARTHFQEFSALRTTYISYIGWRREPFQGSTITLAGPYAQRASVGPADSRKPSVYFFGGSTMWGTGADDANTIPSLVAQLGGFRSANYGETAWTSHQSLALLIQLLQEGHRPDVVVFYDGVNDVAHKCRAEMTPKSHSREWQIRSALTAARKPDDVYGLHYMVGPLMALADTMSNRFSVWFRTKNRHFVCHTDETRARQIADFVTQDWEVARRLVEAYGGKFIGILQPVAYYSDTKLDHIGLSELHKQQFHAVYPLIRQRMAGKPYLYDFTAVLDRAEYIYIDFCHLSPNGNRYVAQKLVEVLAKIDADRTP